jgi:ParB-like chromosome segregation protein Spo0J
VDVTMLPVDSLRPFDLGDGLNNYRHHPPEQIADLSASLDEFGQYRPIVVSDDSVILAGEGIWRAHRQRGLTEIAVVMQPYPHTDPRARKLLVVDNESSRCAVDDDKTLAALLASIQQTDEQGLAGTGWDDSGLDKMIGELAAEDFAAGQLPEGKEYDENLDLSNIKHATCPECGHEFPL